VNEGLRLAEHQYGSFVLTNEGRTDLLGEQFRHLGVTVTQGIDGDSRCEVEVLSVFHIPQEATFSLLEHGRRADIGGNHVWGGLAYETAGLRVRRRVRGSEGCFLLLIVNSILGKRSQHDCALEWHSEDRQAGWMPSARHIHGAKPMKA
jgi:hypothetical protein